MKIHALVASLLCLPLIANADINRAQQLFDEKRFGETLESIDVILATQAVHQQALFLKAMTLQRIGRTDKAIETYQLLNREYPKSPEPYNNLATLYAQQGKHELARDLLLTALNTHPSYATAYKNLGNIYSRMASNAYNKALDLETKKQSPALALSTINKISVPAKSIVKTKAPVIKPAVIKTSAAATITKPKTSANKPKEVELIIDTIQGWSNAWSAQNSDAYLAYYAENFNPPNGYSRQRWEKDRRVRLHKPTFIRVSIHSPKVVLTSKLTARLTFKQDYQSDRFHDAVVKTLLLKKIDGSWQILKEYTSS